MPRCLTVGHQPAPHRAAHVKSTAQHRWLKPKTRWMQGLWCWPVLPALKVATSKPHTPARRDRPQGWQLSSLLQHRAKETIPASTGKLSQPTAHHRRFQTAACVQGSSRPGLESRNRSTNCSSVGTSPGGDTQIYS